MKLLCRCPHCNGLFETSDYSEKGVVCRWCGNDVGVIEYIEVDFDEKKLLDDILADRQQLESVTGINAPSVLNLLIVPLFAAIPVVLVIYKLIMSLPVAWYMWILGVFGAMAVIGVPASIRQSKNIYNALKNLLVQKDYSFDAISAEIPILKSRAEEIKEQKESESELLKELADALERLMPYAYSQITVREQYTKGNRNGIKTGQGGHTAPASMEQDEKPLYIVPPHNCPACNYSYSMQDIKDTTVICPHCSYEINVVDKSVRTETQAMIRVFFLNNKKMEADISNKIMMWFSIILLIVSVGMILTHGIELFFFSWRIVMLFMSSVMFCFYFSASHNKRTLIKNVKNGLNDLFEIELFINKRAGTMQEDFHKLKAEIIKNLKK